jgi:hypothetical protein
MRRAIICAAHGSVVRQASVIFRLRLSAALLTLLTDVSATAGQAGR